MGKKTKYQMNFSAYDAEIYEAMQEPKVFADLFNGSVFQGKQIIKPEMLEQANEKEVLVLKNRKNNPVVLYRLRDLSKNAGFAGGLLCVVLEVEGQRKVHYGMPVRAMTYDAVSYTRQAKLLEKKNRREKKLEGTAEFLSGLKKDDKLYPVLTLVFYYGEEQNWDGPVSLHDMLEFPKELEEWKMYFPDYKINLVSSKTVDNKNFQTGLNEVFELLNVVADAEAMEKLLEEKEEHYKNMDPDKSQLIASFLDIPEIKKKSCINEGGTVNMCTAIREMVNKGKMEGRTEGKAEGRIEEREIIICNMLRRGFSDEDICGLVECEQEIIEEIRKKKHL